MDTRTPETWLAKLAHLLLVEDSPEDATLLEAALHTAHPDCSVTVCTCLQDALDVLEANDVDLVLLDLGLPDSHGLDGLRQIRSVAASVPTVVLTGNDDQRLATEALQAGAQDYLVKGRYEPHTLLRAALYAIDRSETIELKEAGRLKSELLAVVSHEMRTPLTIVRENISLVLDGVLGALQPDQRPFLESAVANCDRLRAMISALVDTAAIERGALSLQRRPFRLFPVLRSVGRDFEPIFAAGHQSFAVDLEPGDGPLILGDPDRLREAIVNLLSNAHKFTEQGGSIWLRSGESDRAAWIHVVDDGVGIAADALEHVFEKFVQLGREHGPGLKGVGLGLPIVRHIVERHGGWVKAESRVGQGSTFAVVLPSWVEGQEFKVWFAPFAVAKRNARGEAWAGFVRVRAGGPADDDVLPRLVDGLRPLLRNVVDEVAFIHREQAVFVAAVGVSSPSPWLPTRLLQALPLQASHLEWAACPVSDAMCLQSLSNLNFVPVSDANSTSTSPSAMLTRRSRSSG